MVMVAAGTPSAAGQGGALNGFKGFIPTAQGRGLGMVLGGATSIIAGADPGGDITTVGSGGACITGGGSGSVPIGGPPDDTVARLVTAPLAVMGEHWSSCAGLSV
jgi:hypothetical protein